MNDMEAIKHRISVRSYSDRTIEESKKKELQAACCNHTAGPFGVKVRFKILDFKQLDNRELRSLGTYGFIRGAKLYILGAVKESVGAFEDLGYCLEKIILEATKLGLGTCWLGGTFRRGSFAKHISLEDDELLPAVTPVGYASRETSGAERMIRFSAGSKKRKPWNELFFTVGGNIPLTEPEAGKYREALEAVRMGPSASNRQPWRIIKDGEGKFHLFLKENELYNRMLGKIRLQNMDMGIAMCHFETAADHSGIAGSWISENDSVEFPGLQYTATWKEE